MCIHARRSFIKQIGLGSAGILLAPSSWATFGDLSMPNNLPRSTPERQGVSSQIVNDLFSAMDESDIEFQSIMVLRNGFVIGEGWWAPYAPEYKHTLHSLSKSFTSAAVGLAIHEGHFTLESPIISFFPDLLPKEASLNLTAMKVKHLLTMTTGHLSANTGVRSNAEPWVQSFLAAPVVHEPGTFYVYNTSATYVLSAIVQKVTGKTLLEYLKPRLLDPLKIEGADWETSPQGINTGGFGLRIRTEDIASFSQLYLNKGKWNGRQLIPEAWVEASTQTQWTFTTNPFGAKTPKEQDDWQQGYGYQFWRTQHNGYRSDGLYGQFGIILPDEQTVIAITEQSFNTQKSLNFIWNVLVPGLQKKALPVNKVAHQKLEAKEAALKIKFIETSSVSTLAISLSSKKYTLETNSFGAKSITFHFTNDNFEMVVNYAKGERRLYFGLKEWEKARNGRINNQDLPFPVNTLPNVSSAVACMATWKDDQTLYLEIRPVETVTCDSITCHFANEALTVTFLDSVSKVGKQKENRLPLTGKLMI